MTHPIIKTENYLLVGSNDDLRRGWFYCVRKNDIFQDEGEDVHCCMGDIRIAAHLPLNNAPTLEEVPLLPPLEDEGFRYIHSLAFDEAIIQYKMNRRISILDLIPMFINGYNKAKENHDTLLKEVLMEFDLAVKKHLLLYPIEHSVHGKMCDGINEIRSKIIQSLQQPKYPVAVKCEMVDNGEEDWIGYFFTGQPFWNEKLDPKTITNSQGLTQLVGKYIY